MSAPTSPQFTLWNLGPQQLQLDFQGGHLVADTGLLAVRAVDRSLRVIAGLAERLPDPRAPQYVTHSVEALLTQHVYALLAGYPDHNDADDLRTDPLFQMLADAPPNPEQPLASGSTLARFLYAHTRRDAAQSPEDSAVLLERRQAQLQRLRLLNDYLVELFVRTRRQAPTAIILDVDATDIPVHGHQNLSAYHGYYQQHQYLPLLVFEGHSGFPLAAWLRPGTCHASLGAVDILRTIVTALRQAWPTVPILVRADNGLGVPAVYDFCETEDLAYVIGYASNAVLLRATDTAWDDLEIYWRCYGHRHPAEPVQRFEDVRDYQAESWPHTRRVVAKLEQHGQGGQRRFVVTNLTLPPEVVYRDIYVQRGAVPEQPIGDMKNGLHGARLSAHGFCANALQLLLRVLAYALVVLFRAAAAAVPEVAAATVATLRQRLWKVGAVVVWNARRVCLRVWGQWPYRELWCRVWQAVDQWLRQWPDGTAPPAQPAAPTM